MKLKHVFFDLDHTLWDFEKNSNLTFKKIFLEQNITIDMNQFLTVYKPLNIKFWKLYRNEKITKEELRYSRLKETFDTINYSISDNKIYEIAIQYINTLPYFNHLFAHTFEILDYLKEKYTLHIITNGFEEIQTKKLESSKILQYFTTVITSDSLGVKKPNPKVFNYALHTAKATPENSIMIGDSVEADILGAMQVGMNVLHCNFDNFEVNNNTFTSIKSLTEIKQYL